MNATLDAPRGLIFDGTPVSPTLWERLRGRWNGTGSWTHWAILDRAVRWPGGASPRFLLRVDDFPRWDRGPDGFRTFHAILRDAGIRYLLGVIPRPAEDPQNPDGRSRRAWTAEEESVIADVASYVEVAVHGLTHRRRPGPVPAEIIGCPANELEENLTEGLAVLREAGISPRTYIPPFNAVDQPGLAILARRFELVFGGPESVRWLGCLPGPCRVEGVWFLPSYPPAYGRAIEVVPFVNAVRTYPIPLLIPITLHWAWEEADRYEGVRRLADALAGTTVTASAWVHGLAWLP